MKPRIFINYRRSINYKDALLLQSHLQRRFGKKRVFLDTSGLDGGENWLHSLEREVDRSTVLLVLIGSGWISIGSDQGGRRLDDPNDVVRLEIARALARQIAVVPVLIDDSQMPSFTDLPTLLLPLALSHAMVFRSASAAEDADKIANRAEVIAATRGGTSALAKVGIASATFAMMIGSMAVGPWVLARLGMPILGVSPTSIEALQKFESMLNQEKAKREEAEAQFREAGDELKRLNGEVLKFKQSETHAREAALNEKQTADQRFAALRAELDSVRSSLSQSQAQTRQASATDRFQHSSGLGGPVPENSPTLTASTDPQGGAKVMIPGPQRTSGRLSWPVSGRIVARFGPRPDGQHNDGIDLVAPVGTPILAALDGVVAYAGNEVRSYGNLVLLRHDNGMVTAYANLEQVTVQRGDRVKRQQPMAKAGTQPFRFEVRFGSKPVDPHDYLDTASKGDAERK